MEKFKLLFRVKYGECDPQNVVFNARYADYVDFAATEYFRAVFGSYQNLVEAGLDTQVVRLVIEWRSPARFDDTLQVTVETAHIGNTSFSLKFAMQEFGSGREIATAEAVYVMVSLQAHQKTRIPDWVREALAGQAQDKVANYAGIELR